MGRLWRFIFSFTLQFLKRVILLPFLAFSFPGCKGYNQSPRIHHCSFGISVNERNYYRLIVKDPLTIFDLFYIDIGLIPMINYLYIWNSIHVTLYNLTISPTLLMTLMMFQEPLRFNDPYYTILGRFLIYSYKERCILILLTKFYLVMDCS